MLSDSDISTLVESGVLMCDIAIDLQGRECFCKREVIENNTPFDDIEIAPTNYFYWFTDIENDLWLQKCLSEQIEDIFNSTLWELDRKVEKRIDRSLVRNKLKVLESFFTQNVVELDRTTYVWKLMDRFRMEMDRFLNYDFKTKKFSFQSFQILRLQESDISTFFSFQTLQSLKNEVAEIKHNWIKEQIEIETQKLNATIELAPIEPKKQAEPTNYEFKKLKWTGTPSEFGAMFDLFLNNGFIEKTGYVKDMVKQLYEMFDIKNEKGETTTFTHLYKCFLEKKKGYPHNQTLKNLYSDNYHKDK